MLDITGKTIAEQQYIKIIGCKVKNDNGIYIVNKQYEKGDFCLYKVNQSGEVAKAKYNIYFLDEKHDKEKQVTIITKEQLKQAAKEVKAYLNGITSAEKVYSFVRTEEQKPLQGLYIHFVKSVLFKGHINNVGGTFEITKILDDGKACLHLIGAKGEQIADNMNGYYQFTPIHINLTNETMQQLFNENDIEILERHASTKGEQVKTNKKQPAKTVSYDEPQTTETEGKQVNEELHIEPERAGEEQQKQKKAINYSIIEDVDTRDNSKIYVVKLVDKITKEEYQEVNEQIKNIGGYYSRFKKGFILKNDPTSDLWKLFQSGTPIENQEQNTENTEQQPKVITPKYYEINEQMASSSRQMWSMSDYVPNSETDSYKNAVNRAYDIVKQIAEQKPEQLAKALTLADRYSRKLAEWKNKEFRIAMMCPSVMICGAGNFPVRKKEKQNRAEDKHMQEYEYVQSILSKIENIGSQREQIKSSDENAIDKLQAKINELTVDLERAKAMNKHYRKYKSMQGFEGLTDEQAVKIDNAISNAYSFDKCPTPSFELASIRNKIKTAEGRIAEIKRLKETAEHNTENQEQSVYNNTVCEVVENTEIMRIQLLFDGKPSNEVRSILKSNGFRWSPSNKAWQRQLTDNARYTTKRVLKQLEEQQAS